MCKQNKGLKLNRRLSFKPNKGLKLNHCKQKRYLIV